MNIAVILAVFIAGLSGIIAQILLLRELLVCFLGNELTLGIILSNWLIAEALGVFAFGKLIDRAKNKVDIFIYLLISFSLFLPVCVYLSRIFKPLIGISPGETIGIAAIFFSSFIIIFAPAFFHAALFSCGCKLISEDSKKTVFLIGNLYSVELLGTIIGGVFSSYVLLLYLNSFQVVFIVSAANLILCLIFLKYSANKILKYIIIGVVGGFIYLAASGSLGSLHKISIERQFSPNKVLDYRNSVYGNIAVTNKEGQNTFFYNGIPLITTPFSDITFVEEFGNFPLFFHEDPREILVLGSGMGGLIAEILKHPVKKIDYVELDPLIIKMLKKFPSDITKKEFSDQRVHISNTDSRFFIRRAADKYDVVLIGFTAPWDLSINRLFTSEFFSLVKARLSDKGIIAFCLPGSLSYISKELKNLNACIFNALKINYAYTRIIPGDYNMFLSSNNPEIMAVNPDLIAERITRLGIKTNSLVPAYLNYRFDKKSVVWFEQSMAQAGAHINQDMKPYAVFQMLVLWNKQFSSSIARILRALSDFNLRGSFLWVFILTALFFAIFKLSRNIKKFSIAYCIATTGFFSMLLNLVLIFSFQVFYGYIYHMIGVLTSVLMAGVCLGSFFMARYANQNRNDLRLFIQLECSIIIFTLFSALILIWMPGCTRGYPYFIFLILFFISGLFVGLEFPLANKIYLKNNQHVGGAVGTLYFADLLGGCIAGVIGGILLLPVLGLFNACVVIILFKLSSLVLLLCAG